MTTVVQREQSLNAEDWIDIQGASGASYSSDAADVGKRLRVRERIGGVDAFSDPFGPVISSGTPEWFPTPPTTWKATGSMSTPVLVDTVQGSAPGYSLFHPQRQHIVQNAGGIFFAYSYYEDGHTPSRWRLKRSQNNGATWTTVYSEPAPPNGYNNGGCAPGVETDLAGNVYVIVSQYGDTSQNYFKIFKFSPPNYSTPTIWSYSNFGGANKWSCVFDQTRNWIWMKAWQRSSLGELDLLAVDLNGVIQRQLQIQKPWDHTYTYAIADAEYPSMDVDHNGLIAIGFSNIDIDLMNNYNQLNYYEVRAIYSDDGGETWRGPSGVLPAAAAESDGTGTPANRMYLINDPTAGVEFLPKGNANYKPLGSQLFNFNAIGQMAIHKGAAHFWYSGMSGAVVGGDHRSYARWNLTSKAIDRRHFPLAPTDGGGYSSLNASWSQDSAQSRRLYLIGVGGGSDYGSILISKTDDNGDTFTRYASVPSPTALPNYPTAQRFVNSDGTFNVGWCAQDKVYFSRVTPV